MSRLEDLVNEHIEVYNRFIKEELNKKAVVCAADKMVEALKHDGALFFFGNGGSAADAQHIATEFVSRFYKERKAINAEALTTNTSSITAIANDYSFERVFARQIEAKGRAKDIAIGISTSGNSPSVLVALDTAKSRGMTTVLLTSEKCELNCEYDLIIKVPSLNTPRIQEMHIFIGHFWAEYVEKEMSVD